MADYALAARLPHAWQDAIGRPVHPLNSAQLVVAVHHRGRAHPLYSRTSLIFWRNHR